MAPRPVLRGTVTSFDKAVGLGVVLGADGSEIGFHATALSDGTRDIEPGVEVAYETRPGHVGRVDARFVTRLPQDRRTDPPLRRS